MIFLFKIRRDMLEGKKKKYLVLSASLRLCASALKVLSFCYLKGIHDKS